jgi:hypothetical protein
MRIIQLRRNRVVHLALGSAFVLLIFYFIYSMPHDKVKGLNKYLPESLQRRQVSTIFFLRIFIFVM